MRGLMMMAAAAAMGWGCATTPDPVPLVIDPQGEQMLNGVWAGEYNSGSGRAGSITFMFVMHEGVCEICGMEGIHAHGDVLMIPRGLNDPVQPADGEYQGAGDTGPQVLRMEMVHVTGNHVRGTIEPYRDPETGHSLSSTFEGTIAGDRITGEFITVDGRTGIRDVGSWDAKRKKER
jgi:hypothetical protein